MAPPASCSSAGPTSASPRSSIASPAPAGRSWRRWPAPRAMSSRRRPSWKDRTFTLVDTGGLFGATTDPLHALVVEHGLKALERADVFVFVVDAQEGLVPGDEEIARRLHDVRASRSSWPSTRRTTSGRASARDRVLSDGLRAGVRGGGRARRRRLRAARRGATRSCPRRGQARRARAGRDEDCVRRPAERREVVARQPAAARRARDGERDAGHDARHHRRRCCQWQKRRLRMLDTAGHAAAGPGGRRAGRSKP